MHAVGGLNFNWRVKEKSIHRPYDNQAITFISLWQFFVPDTSAAKLVEACSSEAVIAPG